MLDGPVKGNNFRAANELPLNIGPLRAAHCAALAAQARHVITGRAGPGTTTIVPCCLGSDENSSLVPGCWASGPWPPPIALWFQLLDGMNVCRPTSCSMYVLVSCTWTSIVFLTIILA
jgi:hypothetical protein